MSSSPIAAPAPRGPASPPDLIIGFYPGLVLLVPALALAFTQRGALGRAIRTPDSTLRRRRLVTAGILAAICALSVVSYLRDIDDDTISGSA